MTRVVTTIDIERPVEDVFGFLTDLDNLPQWAVGLLEVRHDGHVRLGAKGVEVRMVGKKKTEMPWEVIRYEPPRVVAFAYSEPLPATATFTMEPIAGGTRLTCDTELELKGIYRLMAPMIVKEARQTDAKQFAKAKATLEGRGADRHD